MVNRRLRNIIKKISLENLQLRNESERYREIIENIEDGYFESDLKGRITFSNKGMAKMFGYNSPSDLEGLHYKAYTDEENANILFRAFNEVYKTGVPKQHVEWRLKDATGQARYVRSSVTPMTKNKEPAGFCGIVRDVTEQKQAEEELRKAAFYDTITGRYNKKGLRQQFNNYIDLQRLGVLSIDTGKMDFINMAYGHKTGDKFLEAITERIKSIIDDNDLARIQAGNFACLLPNGENDIMETGYKIINNVRKPINVNNNIINPDVRAGISLYPNHGQDLETLLRKADMAKFHAGSQELLHYSPKKDKFSYLLKLQRDIEKAITKDEFRLYCHPILNTSENTVIGFENLLRWKHPEFGLVPPGDFIPLFENSDKISSLSEMVIDKACQNYVQCVREGKKPQLVTFNLSARDLYSKEMEEILPQYLSYHNINPEKMGVELTETSVMHEPEKGFERLNHLADKGVKVLLDDFGTGYSSLSYLSRAPAGTIVKIDREFLKGVPNNTQNSKLVTAMTRLVHSLGMQVLAEGIENKEQESYIRGVGADYTQGFLYGKPAPAEQIVEMISQKPRHL